MSSAVSPRPPPVSFHEKFAAVGKVDYVCTIHPTQTGTITVE